jgi:transposase
MLCSHAGAARFAWNWALAKCRERHDAEGKWYSAADLHKLWNATKKADPALGWWGENSKCVYQEAFRDLDRALRDFSKSKKGRRKGRQLGFPRFKKRGKCRDAFRFSTGVIRCADATVTLPRLGTIRTHESAHKLARRLASNTARILSATVSRTAQCWFVSFTVEVERAIPHSHARPGSAVGIDLGVRTLLTGVDDHGTVVTMGGPGRCGLGCGTCAMPAAPIHGRTAGRRTGASRQRGWPASTRGLRTCALMPFTRPPPNSPAGTRPWWSKTSTWPR